MQMDGFRDRMSLHSSHMQANGIPAKIPFDSGVNVIIPFFDRPRTVVWDMPSEAEAKAIEAVRTALGTADYAEYLKAIRLIDAQKEIFAGKDVKTIFLPYETGKVLGAVGALSEMARTAKEE